jgi:predicted permease
MAHFIPAVETVLPLFLVIFAGALFSRTKACSGHWVDILNKYALYIGFPALIIGSLMQLEIEKHVFSNLILLNSANILVCTLLAFPIARVFRLRESVKRSLFLILPFTNNAYLGMPILQNAYGDEILPVAAVISSVYLFWMFTLTIILLESSGENKTHPKKLIVNLLQNPMLISVIVGFLIVVFQVKMPVYIEKTLHLFAGSVTAVVLFSIGIFMGMHKIGNITKWSRVAVFAFFTMFVLPAVFYLAIRSANISAEQLKATIIDAAMPLGLTPYALSVQYNLETTLIARIVVFGTIISVVTIPLWMVWVG